MPGRTALCAFATNNYVSARAEISTIRRAQIKLAKPLTLILKDPRTHRLILDYSTHINIEDEIFRYDL